MDYMFRIVEKKTGDVIYYESISSANKALMVQRCQDFLAHHTFTSKTANKDFCVEFSYFDWKNRDYSTRGYSEYGYHWRCTTVVGLKYAEDGKHLEYGEHISGRKLNFSTKPKGGSWGAMMIDMGLA